jgi:hypothetical protein
MDSNFVHLGKLSSDMFLNLVLEFSFLPLSVNIDFFSQAEICPRTEIEFPRFAFQSKVLSGSRRVVEAGAFALLWFECRMCGNANVPDCAE